MGHLPHDHGVADNLRPHFGDHHRHGHRLHVDDRGLPDRLAEVDADSDGRAQGQSREALGILIDTAAVRGGLDVRDNGHPLGDIQGEGDTGTAAEGAVVDPGPAEMDVGDDVAVGADEHVAMDVLIALITEIREFVGNRKALETGAETAPVAEPVAEIQVVCDAGAIVRSFAVRIALAVKAEIHSESGAHEPAAVVFRFFLGTCRDAKREKGGRDECNLFHSLKPVKYANRK